LLRDYQEVLVQLNISGFITANENIVVNPYYIGGDLIGKQGVEESYEKQLRGQKKEKYILITTVKLNFIKWQNTMYH
jgi:penicillin-binding protein 2